MKNDDEQVGRVLSRREVVKLLGVTGMAALVGCGPELATPDAAANAAQPASTLPPPTTADLPTADPTIVDPTAMLTEATAVPNCIVRPELTEGPYFVDDRLNRSDIRSDPTDGSVREGALLYLAFNVSQINANGCTPLPGAFVDVWHCDAHGVYSGVRDPSFDATGQQFLRGYQETDTNGQAQFLTIYPGWYNGRAVHIHFKVRTALDQPGYEFTSQLFFDEDYTDGVYTQEPYASTGQRTVLNSQDGIFQRSGEQLLLTVTETSDGYTAVFDIGLDMT